MTARWMVHGLGTLALVLLSATGCGEPASQVLVGVDTDPSMGLAGAAEDLPFRLSGRARLIAQDLAPGFPGGRSDFDGRCSTLSDFVISFAMTAEATHLGRVTAHFEHCTQVDFDTGASYLTDGVATLVAADGDELHARYATAEEPDDAFDEMVVFDGGTGRFEDATGTALGNSVCDRAAGTCTYEARGRIAYDASGRRGG
ncbi:MAG: hypothetical protein R3304_10915 [Longimicrobiales bacterium]|nr:hypothetical protein [Longimicrobiales bacterium]